MHKDHRRTGIGRALLERLVAVAEEQDYHLMVAGIDAANAASIALHVELGFTCCGAIHHAGFKFGRWLDLASTSGGCARRRIPSTARID